MGRIDCGSGRHGSRYSQQIRLPLVHLPVQSILKPTVFANSPKWAEQLASDPQTRPKKLAMFYTGGIRCEIKRIDENHVGFEEVYHLSGILRYLEEVPAEDSSWQGECFVFDGRVAVDHDLRPGQYAMCHACRMPLAPDDLKHPDYEAGVGAITAVQDTRPRSAQTLYRATEADAAGG